MNTRRWLGVVGGVAIAASALSGIATYSLVPGDASDVVVGVLLKCNVVGGGGNIPYASVDRNGAECPPPEPNVAIQNRRLAVTVRRARGTTYDVELPSDTPVKVGDPWPPK